jgi:hypothetical protein
MNRPQIITLIGETFTRGADGVYKPVQTARSVIADVQSVTGSEWFEGGRNGLNPEFRMRVFNGEYKGETVLIYQGIAYTIYRTYLDSDIMELYVEKRKGNESKD